jgi:hypothetical protein
MSLVKRIQVSPLSVCTRRSAGRGTGRPIAISGQTGLKLTQSASSFMTKPMRLCPPSNRTADPVRHPLIPMTGLIFMVCDLLMLSLKLTQH